MNVTERGTEIIDGPTAQTNTEEKKAKRRHRLEAVEVPLVDVVATLTDAYLEDDHGRITGVELDTDDGVVVWEADVINADGVAWEVDVSVTTGEIIDTKRD